VVHVLQLPCAIANFIVSQPGIIEEVKAQMAAEAEE